MTEAENLARARAWIESAMIPVLGWEDADPVFLREAVAACERALMAAVRAKGEADKEIYRSLHCGGCRALSRGEKCGCFLCQVEAADVPEVPRP